MPYWYNGIGTIYYGRTHESTRRGWCEHCKAERDLASFDTRLYVIFVFLPIVPLGAKRVIDKCAKCAIHRALPLHAVIEHDAALVVVLDGRADQIPDVSVADVVVLQIAIDRIVREVPMVIGQVGLRIVDLA